MNDEPRGAGMHGGLDADGDAAAERDALAQRVAAGLALIDAGRVGDARRELEALLAALRRTHEPAAPVAEEIALEEAVGEGELERAFAEATPEESSMLDADRIAQEAMREAELDLPEGVMPLGESPFATRTVADLLERQGHTDAAERIRARLAERTDDAAPASAPLAAAQRARTIATLERWLGNLQRGVA